MGRTVSGGVFWIFCELSITLGSLSADGWVCVPVLLVVWHEVSSGGGCRQLGGTGSWIRMEASVRALTVNIPWGQEFSGGPASWTQCSHPRGSGPTSGRGARTLQATCHGNKGD